MTSTHHGVSPYPKLAINMLSGSGQRQGAGRDGHQGEGQGEEAFEYPDADEWDSFLKILTKPKKDHAK